jgi:GT2 family glycosyltransferase
MYKKTGGARVVVTDRAKEKLQENVFIGIIGIDCVDYSKAAYDSVISNAEKVKFLYIDNGSTPESLKVIENWALNNQFVHEFESVFNNTNAGVGPAWNQILNAGIEWGATKIIICNNDIVFHPKTVDGLCEAFNRQNNEDPRTVMVSAFNNKVGNYEQLKSIKQKWEYAECPDFSCFMVEPKFKELFGGFSEDYKPAYFEDNETHWHVLARGYKAWGNHWAPYWHVGSRTRFSHPNIVPHDTYRANRRLFHSKWNTPDVKQEIIIARYERWLNDNPDTPHPTAEQLLKYCEDNDCWYNEIA